MPYPYKKMTQADFDYIRSVTADNRVWVGDDIAKEYHHDEMPEYGVFPPELYVEVENKEEISAIMAYAYQENIVLQNQVEIVVNSCKSGHFQNIIICKTEENRCNDRQNVKCKEQDCIGCQEQITHLTSFCFFTSHLKIVLSQRKIFS